MGIESPMALTIWTNAFGFDGVKYANLYINKVLIRRKLVGVEAQHKTEKNQKMIN